MLNAYLMVRARRPQTQSGISKHGKQTRQIHRRAEKNGAIVAEPQADRGPRAGSPRGVVVASGCYIRPR